MSPLGHILSRHLTGLLDPVWLLTLAGALGLAGGLAVLNPKVIFMGLPAAVLYIVICYLATAVLFSLIERALQFKWGATAIGTSGFAIFTVVGIAGPLLLTSDHRDLWRTLDQLLRFLPPGITASLLAGANSKIAVLDGMTLIACCALLAVTLAALERRSPVSQARTAGGISWESLYERVADRFGRGLGPLVGKGLRYHLRCNRVRFNVAVAVPMIVFLPRLMGRSSGPDGIFLTTLAIFFLAGIASVNSIMLNQFGYDGAGIRRYLILPVPLVAAVRAASVASLLVGGPVILCGLAIWMLISRSLFEARMILMLLSSGIAGLLFFTALGLWTTILSPRSMDFRSTFGNQQSPGANLVMIGGIACVFGGAFALVARSSLAVVLHYWWLFPLAAICCAGLNVVSHQLIGKVLELHRALLIDAIAGAGQD